MSFSLSKPLYGLLFLAVAFIAWLQWLTPRVLDADQQAGSSPDFLLMARNSVGSSRLMGGSALNAQAFANLAAQAQNPLQKVRLIILEAELVHKDQALASIERLQEDPEFSSYSEDFSSLMIIYQQGASALDDAARQALIQRHGWFGSLATGYGLSNYHALRAPALSAATRTSVSLLGAFFVVSLGLLVGCALMVLGAALYSKGKLKLAFRSPLREGFPPNTAFLEVMVMALLMMPLLGFAAAFVPQSMGFLVQGLFVIALFWPLLRGLNFGEICEGLGWNMGKGFFREVVAGVAGYLAGLPILGVGLLLTILLANLGKSNPSHPIVELFNDMSPARFVMVFLFACVWAPLAEESLFRGALYRHLRLSQSALISGLIQGLVFAAIHPQGWAGIPILCAIGFVFGVIREWRDCLIGSVVAHGINNGAALGMMFLLLS